MANDAAIGMGNLRMVALSCLGLAVLGLLWGCAVESGGFSSPGIYGPPGPAYGVAGPYDGDPFWNGWGGGYYGGFYGRGFGGTRLYHGGGRGLSRGGGFGGHRGH
jgi:hypothetical protein